MVKVLRNGVIHISGNSTLRVGDLSFIVEDGVIPEIEVEHVLGNGVFERFCQWMTAMRREWTGCGFYTRDVRDFLHR